MTESKKETEFDSAKAYIRGYEAGAAYEAGKRMHADARYDDLRRSRDQASARADQASARADKADADNAILRADVALWRSRFSTPEVCSRTLLELREALGAQRMALTASGQEMAALRKELSDKQLKLNSILSIVEPPRYDDA